MQLSEIQAEAQVNGGAVVAGLDEIVVAALADRLALGWVGRCGRCVVCWRPCCAGRRDGCVGLGECASGGAFWLTGSRSVSMPLYIYLFFCCGFDLPFTHTLACSYSRAAALNVGVPTEKLGGGNVVRRVGISLGKLVAVSGVSSRFRSCSLETYQLGPSQTVSISHGRGKQMAWSK